jgi:DNA-binding transcriptional MerR regulator
LTRGMVERTTLAIRTFVGLLYQNYEERQRICAGISPSKCVFLLLRNENKVGVNLVESSNVGSKNIGENKSVPALKIKEVAVLLGETPDVIRNWLKEIGELIPHEKNDSGYKTFDEKGVETLRVIKQLTRNQGYTLRQIQHYLASGGKEFAPMSEVPDTVKLELSDIRQLLEQQNEFNSALLDRLDQQQKYIEDSINKRDQQLMATMRAIQEPKQEKQSILNRIFGRKKT